MVLQAASKSNDLCHVSLSEGSPSKTLIAITGKNWRFYIFCIYKWNLGRAPLIAKWKSCQDMAKNITLIPMDCFTVKTFLVK